MGDSIKFYFTLLLYHVDDVSGVTVDVMNDRSGLNRPLAAQFKSPFGDSFLDQYHRPPCKQGQLTLYFCIVLNCQVIDIS